MIENKPKPEIKWDPDCRIYREENVLTEELCKEIIEYGKKNVQPGVNKYPGLFSVKFDACLLPLDHEVHTVLQGAWNRAMSHLGIDAEFVEPYELKRYTRGDFFSRHTDNYYGTSGNLDRKITMSILLNHHAECIGGKLFVSKEKVRPTVGA